MKPSFVILFIHVMLWVTCGLNHRRLALEHARDRLVTCSHYKITACLDDSGPHMPLNDLPDLILFAIFNFLTTSERLILRCVCRRWNILLRSAQVWTCVDFSNKRELSLKVLETFVFPATRKLFVDECHVLKWRDICLTLKQCRKLEVLSLSWIGYVNEPQIAIPLDFVKLKIGHLRYLNVSYCTLSDRFFEDIATNCPHLSVFILLGSCGISEEAFKSSTFKSHTSLKLINVAYVTNALRLSCVLGLLEYRNNSVLLDVTGHHISDDEMNLIDPQAFARIVEIDDYCHLLY